MNKHLLFIGILISFLFCSCSNLENEVWINKDGSGKTKMQYDMSPMLAMAAFAEGMENSSDSKEDKSLDNSDEDLMAIIQGMTDPSKVGTIDTSFNFYAVLSDSVKQKLDAPELLKNVIFTMDSNKKEGRAIMDLEMKYKSTNELDKIFESFTQMAQNTGEKDANLKGLKSLMYAYQLDMKKGTVTFPEQDIDDSGEGNPLNDEDIDFENMEESERAMIEAMIGDVGITMTLHLPGKVLSCDDPSATIEGNTVYFKDDFLNVMKTRKLKGRVVKFKK